MEFGFEMEEFFFFALHHLVDRNSCPSGNHIGYVFRVNLFFNEGFFSLHHFQLFLNGGVFLFFLLYFRVADFCHFGIVALAFGAFGVEVELFDVYLVLLDLVDQVFLGLPFGCEFFFLIAQIGE